MNQKKIGTLGIIAGGGAVPRMLLSACDSVEQNVFVIGFEGQTDPALMQGREFMMVRLGAAGRMIDTLRAHGIRDLVFIGAVRRPSFLELMPDMRALQFFTRIGLKALGDDGLLKAVRSELEKEGFVIHGVQKFVENLLAKEGNVGSFSPKGEDWYDIDHGLSVSHALGIQDVGQSVIVQEGIVLGVEAAEGTDELIRRCAAYRRKGSRGGVLVKTCKPQQDRDFDLPAIGPQTVLLCAQTGLSGIVVQAGHSLVIEPQEVAALADRHKMFVTAVRREDLSDDF